MTREGNTIAARFSILWRTERLSLRDIRIADGTNRPGGANDGSSWADAFTDLQSALATATGNDEIWIAEGTYTFLEFEVEDLELDEQDVEEGETQAELEAILTEIRGMYPDFPAGASMVVSGEFVPTTGEPQAFTTYFAAEIEIEMALDPVLEVPTDEALTINVDPSVWFTGFDFLAAEGQLVEFEVEMENGFVEVEVIGSPLLLNTRGVGLGL